MKLQELVSVLQKLSELYPEHQAEIEVAAIGDGAVSVRSAGIVHGFSITESSVVLMATEESLR